MISQVSQADVVAGGMVLLLLLLLLRVVTLAKTSVDHNPIDLDTKVMLSSANVATILNGSSGIHTTHYPI